VRDFAPISNLGLTPQTLVVSASSELKTLKDLVEHAKKAPLDYASSGNGSASHLAMEMFRTASGVQLSHVPFKGSSGRPDAGPGGQGADHVRRHPRRRSADQAGKLARAGIASPERSRSFPDVPTIAEQGLSGIRGDRLIGIVRAGAHPGGDPRPAQRGGAALHPASRGQGAPH